MSVETKAIPTAFIWRRVHSLLGFWIVLYLIFHLITNSQAALWIGDDGSGFIRLVNSLETMPYLQVIETVLIGIPFAFHMIWGIKRALQAKMNSVKGKGNFPSLPYERNRAFTWQRWTSWILVLGIIGHVVQMRFYDAPKKVKSTTGDIYLTRVTFDEGLETLTERLGVRLVTFEALEAMQKDRTWMEVLSSFKLEKGEALTISSMPGTAFLLMVRDTFKSPFMAILYTIFLLAAAFHAFNGFWTFLITWGMILSYRSQRAMIPVSWGGVILLCFLGIAAIWGTYWINLRH